MSGARATRRIRGALPAGSVTFLFTDIEGSTKLFQRLGDRYPFALAEHQHLCREVFRERSGHEVGTEGDAFFVAFSNPTDATLAAVECQRALAGHAWPEDAEIRIRIGIHTGEALVVGHDYVGLAVHRAARISSAAHGGQVLISGTTADLLESSRLPDVDIRELGEHALKDFPNPERLVEIVIPDLPSVFPPPKTLEPPLRLPAQPTRLVGRTTELQLACDLLQREDLRLVTLTGPGGTGKTRLGIEIAARLRGAFGHGVFFVGLATVRDPAELTAAVAHALGVQPLGRQTVAEIVEDYLRDKHVLLLLDNLEHLPGATPFIAGLLDTARHLKVLATSRAPLHLSTEHELAVTPLPLPAPGERDDPESLSRSGAIELFVERAQAARPDFALTYENAAAVRQICLKLDGLPLALELAAARLRVLSPQGLHDRLERRLRLLTGGAQDLPDRQRTLRATLDWSYDLLSPDDRSLLARLSVFASACTIEEAEAVLDPDDEFEFEIIDGLTSLTEKSLLQPVAGAEPRLAMLQTIREYALERLEESGDADRIRLGHAHYFRVLAERAEPQLRGPNQQDWLERLEREHDDLRAALEWTTTHANAEVGMRLGAALWRFWQLRGYQSEGRARVERLLALPADTVSATVRAAAEACAGRCALFESDYTAARAFFERSLATQRTHDDRPGMAFSYLTLALVRHMQHTEPAAARAAAEESLVRFEELGDAWGAANARLTMGWILTATGDGDAARALIEQALRSLRSIGDVRLVAAALDSLGSLARERGDEKHARLLLEESLAIRQQLRDTWGIPLSLTSLGLIAEAGGDLRRARLLYEESLAMRCASGERAGIVASLEGLAGLQALEANPLRAAQLFAAADALRQTLGMPRESGAQTAHDDRIEAVRAALGDDAFRLAWADGAAMPLDHAVMAAGVLA